MRVPRHRSPVVFTNRRGLHLFGVLHWPRRVTTPDLAVILLSPGVKMRVGPERLYLRMAESFVSLGVPVFRFDFAGLGDSEGELSETMLREVYEQVELGRYVSDTIDAMDWMQQQFGIQRFLLSGLCGGAVTGLHAGGQDGRVVGLLGVGITPVVSARATEASRYMTAGQLKDTRAKYIRRLLSLTAWRRMITLKADYRLMWRFVRDPLRARLGLVRPTEAGQAPNDNANPLFPSSFFRMLAAKRPIFLAFGSSDRLQWEFEEKFVARHSATLASLPPLYDVHIVKDGNHVLSLSDWQQDMLDASVGWMRKRFPDALPQQQRTAASS